MPFTGIKLNYRELTNKEHLILSKAAISFAFDSDLVEDYGSLMQKILSECVEQKELFFQLNLIEYFLFACRLRIITIGNTIELKFNSSMDGFSSFKSTIDINRFTQKVYQLCESFKDIELEDENYKIILNWPSILSEKFFITQRNQTNSLEYIKESLCEYVDELCIKNKQTKITFIKFSHKEKEKLFEKIPLSLQNKILKIIIDRITPILDADIFGLSVENCLKFNFYNTSHQYILRLLFSSDLQQIYEKYYILASKNLNPSYLDSITVGDLSVYFSLVQKEMEGNNESLESLKENTDNITG